MTLRHCLVLPSVPTCLAWPPAPTCALAAAQVKTRLKSFRIQDQPLDLHGHVVLLFCSSSPQLPSILRQMASRQRDPSSRLYGKPLVRQGVEGLGSGGRGGSMQARGGGGMQAKMC